MQARVGKWYTQETITGETISEKDLGSLFVQPSPLSEIYFYKTQLSLSTPGTKMSHFVETAQVRSNWKQESKGAEDIDDV